MSTALWSRSCLLFPVCLTIYTSAVLSHTERDSVGVKGSLEMGMTASLPLLYRVDRLLLQQHQWWKIDDVALLLLKPTEEATKSNCHIIFYIDGKHLPTVLCRAAEGEWLSECQRSLCRLCCVVCFIFQSFFWPSYDSCDIIRPSHRCGLRFVWICRCHSCHVCASNCLSEESAPWGPSAKPGFRSVYPHWDSVSWDGMAAQCP